MFYHPWFNMPSSCWQIRAPINWSMICSVLLLHDVLWAVFIPVLSNNLYEMFIAVGLNQSNHMKVTMENSCNAQQKAQPWPQWNIYDLMWLSYFMKIFHQSLFGSPVRKKKSPNMWHLSEKSLNLKSSLMGHCVFFLQF